MREDLYVAGCQKVNVCQEGNTVENMAAIVPEGGAKLHHLMV